MRLPNILLFVMDVQRFDNLSCYGYAKETSPNIDKIASEGTLFLNNISPAIWTLPSHASLFTGNYISGHGVGMQYQSRPKAPLTLTEVLKSIGYRTVGFCRASHLWARYGIDDERGFDTFVGVEFKEGEDEDNGSLRTSTLVREWLDDNYKDKRPFFMFINCVEPYLPYWPPQLFRKRFLVDGISDEQAYQMIPNPWMVQMGKTKLTPKEWTILKSLYDGETATLARDFAVSEYQTPLLCFERIIRLDPDFDFRIFNRTFKAYRTLEYKYFWASDGKDELYNIAQDPLEQENLISQMPEKAAEMKKKLEAFLLSIDQTDHGDKITGEENTVKRLRTWGFWRDFGNASSDF